MQNCTSYVLGMSKSKTTKGVSYVQQIDVMCFCERVFHLDKMHSEIMKEGK